MSERTPARQPGSPSTEPKPRLTRHEINWEISDFSALTLGWIRALGDQIETGCHFLNPLYTVSSPRPTATFYRQAIWARDGWINLFRDTIRPLGFHDLSKSLTPSPKQLQISGIMYRDGAVVPPPVWYEQADAVLDPDLPLITSHPHPANLAGLQTPEGREALMALSRAEVQRLLSCRPSAAFYVTPDLSLTAPRLSPTFLSMARRSENKWHRRLSHRLGRERRQFTRSADLPTELLCIHGILIAEGRAYLPGQWPDKVQSKAHTNSSPYASGTVSLEFLGLELRLGRPLGCRKVHLDDSTAASPRDPSTLNEQFKSLLSIQEPDAVIDDKVSRRCPQKPHPFSPTGLT